MLDLVAQSAARLFADHRETMIAAMPAEAESGAVPFQQDLWSLVEEQGFGLALLSEDDGGFGLTAAEAFGIVRLAAENAIPLPLGETMVANWLCARAGLPPCDGPASFALLHGDSAPRIAYGRDAAVLVLVSRDGRLARVGHESVTLIPGHNTAGEPRDGLTLTGTPDWRPSPVSAETVPALGALLRAVALSGAIGSALQTTIDYSGEREQFGRPLRKFQVLQHYLAVMASQSAAATAAADSAVAAFALLDAARPVAESDFIAHVATAKQRTGEAAGIVAAQAHQITGAIGFSHEFALHPFTRRLWAWRDEWGSESHWARILGARMLAGGALWPQLTDLGEAIA